MSKKMASKLAESLRQIQTDRPPEPAMKQEAAAIEPPESRARRDDQSPPASLYRPWENLHPARIWPD